MTNLNNLQLFLENYLQNKNIKWLELFIFEFYQQKKHSKGLLLELQGNDKFIALSYHMSYHLLKLLFSTICDLMASSDDNAVLSLRNFLTSGLGSQIITIMSSDLDLSKVTNERELANVLTKIFPTECWEAEPVRSYLEGVKREDVKGFYNKLWLLDIRTVKESEESEKKIVNAFLTTSDAGDAGSFEEFFTEEFKKYQQDLNMSSSQLALKVIEILKKLVKIENANALGQTDPNSVTLCCLHFSLDHLNDQNVFSDNDQTVINVNLMELTFLCFNNLVNRDGKSIEPIFKKLFHLLETNDNHEISCGLIVNILTVLNNLCIKESIQKTENLNMFLLCNHLILKKLEILSCDRELLDVVQMLLIRIIRNVRKAQISEQKKSKKRGKKLEAAGVHHNSQADGCIFERLLIESFPLLKSFKNLSKILRYFRAKGICCCNGTIENIKIFMRPSLVSTEFLSFIQDQIIQPTFEKRLCIHCNDKHSSRFFRDEYFYVLKCEIHRRQGWELHALLHHLTALQKIFSRGFLQKFVFTVILPTFQEHKVKFLEDPEVNFESKIIVASCLNILNESMRDEAIVEKFFTINSIMDVRDCTLVPDMASNACQLLKIASDNLKLFGDNREELSKVVNNILFSNALYLIRELMEIYEQLDLPKDVLLKLDKSEDFEILDEKTVAVKEALSDLDILFLNTIHWNILCDLVTSDLDFQQDFVANIYNNFSGNILFTIAYNALNSILLKKELTVPKTIQSDSLKLLPIVFQRCDFLTPVLVPNENKIFTYKRIVENCFYLHEISHSFGDRLHGDVNELALIYRSRDKETKFRTFVHRDVFLTDNVDERSSRNSNDDDHQRFFFHGNWLNQFVVGIFEGAAIRDRLVQIINKFVRSEYELKAIHRVNTIKEITGRCGVKYLTSIARNCFDICWRLSDNISFSAKMSTALEELKLLLLQDNWNDNKEVMIDALQLLLGVAEMKTKNVSRMLFMDPENHLGRSTESMFSDFNSSLDRVTFDDDESSTDKKTETFHTSDENYDADEEFHSIADTECSQSFRASSLPATLTFRNTNEHICKLVVEILMDLSKRCVERPEQWQPSILMSLAQRLTCMKSFLGGTTFLLKGFAPILQNNQECLLGLQKTILSLVENLNSPEAFKAFLSILTVNEAAIDPIVKQLEILCSSEETLKPFMRISFPITDPEATVTSTCDSHLHKLIQTYRDVHLGNKLLTPFTESSQIVPLNFMDFKPWNSQGFTVSVWLEIEAFEGEKAPTHLLSLGTEKLLLAIYLNDDGSFNLCVTKPNQNFSDSGKFSKVQSSNKENENRTNIFGIALATLSEAELPNILHRSSVKHGVKEETAKRLQTSKISVKSKRLKVKSDRWTHVCFSARSNDMEIMLLITINGTEQELVEIPIDGMRESDVNGMLQLLCVGAQSVIATKALKYSISNLMLFRSPLESPTQTSHLFAFGPDCDNLIDCEALQQLPLLGLLDVSKIANKPLSVIGSKELTARLKGNVILIYSMGRVIGYKSSDLGKHLESFKVGKVAKALPVFSFARSIQLSGGLSTLLFLFARTIEVTDDPVTQASALYIFLKMSYSNSLLYAEFEQKNLFDLVAHVFKHSKCYRGPGMLKAVLDVIYGGTMFNRRSRSDDFQINERSELNIQNPKLLLKLLENFNIFQSPEILDLLFKSLMVVVRQSHPSRVANRQCLLDHDFYEKLIDFCKIHLTNSANSIAITSPTALVIVNLLKMLQPSPAALMQEIQNLLLLMHHPSESFVTHDRSKFNFILPQNKPQKQSKLSLSGSLKGSRYFNFSIKIRSTAPQSPPAMDRSTSSSKSLKIATPNRKFRARKFDELSESQSLKIAKALTKKEVKTPNKIQVRRLQHTPKMSPYKKLATPKKKLKVYEVTEEDQQLLETFKSLMSATSLNSLVSDVDVNRYETGVSVLQENLFKMLRDSVMFLDDFQAAASDFLPIEMLVMFANHHDANVRAAIIELIHVITERQSPEVVARHEKSNLWTHLANQLAISRVNLRTAQACVDWICMDKISLQDLSRAQKIQVKYKPAFGLLISMLPAMVHDVQLVNYTTKFLRLILETQESSLTPTMMNCLISASIKALMKLEKHQDRVKEAILMMLEQIAVKSLATQIQPLWDLLYGLTFVERNKKKEVVREVHVSILKQLISLCLVEQNRRGSSSLTIAQALGNLPSTEVKTRFNLIHDRAVQFVSSWDFTEDLTTCELEFVKFLMQLQFSGFHHGSSLLLIGLNPNGDEEIKSFIVQKLSQALTKDSNFSLPGNDSKLIKSLLIQHLNTANLPSEVHETISMFCGTSANQQQQNWNWSMSAVEKIDAIRQTALRDQSSSVDKIVFKLEQLVQSVIDGAMKMTRNVIDVQNQERRQLMNQLKKTQEIDFYREWFDLIKRMTHEDAPWFNVGLCPGTWELDETEGPGRTRVRLKRNVLMIEERFFNDEFKIKASYQHKKPLLNFLLRPEESERYSIQDRIVFTFNAKHLTMEQEIAGEVIVTDTQLIFLANKDTYINSIICDIKNISEILDRRYQHREVSLEIFLLSKKTFFIIFEANYERDIVKKFFFDRIDKKKPEDIVNQWIDSKLTNFEYLTELNKISGRTYNDLMQYPVFPWILTDYESEVLDLKSTETFRKLNKTISTQYEEMEEHYVNNYKYLAQSADEQIMKPYHYSSHYSNSGTILHFLVRLPPFTNMFLLYQDHNFDIPDRTFHSMATTYRLTSKESATDVKELIPEFFFLFDFFENSEGFNFGKRQSGELVNDVKLPRWCEGNARLFMLIHRQALESDFVRKHLNQWIDLIFGFKQKGSAAVSAINVFHPATYPEFQITNITDPVERSAYETMVKTYGQMPKQIFSSAHRKSSPLTESSVGPWPVLKTVKGLRWGVFTGSPQLTKPKKVSSMKKFEGKIARLVPINDANFFYGLPEKCHLMRATKHQSQDLVLWNEADGIVRVKSLKDKHGRARKLFHIPMNDPVTACGCHVKYSSLWFGHESGNVSVYVRADDQPLKRQENNQKKFNDTLESIIGIKEGNSTSDDNEIFIETRWNFPIVLIKHRGEVLDLKVCVEFKIVVSIGSDGRTVIWDAEKIEYIRTIEPSCNTLKSQLTHVEVSPTLGDILTVFSPRNEIDAALDEESFEVTDSEDFINVSMAIAGKSQLRLHTINAKYIKHTFTDGFATAACFSFIKEGTGVNVIAVGFDDGTIRMYSTWTLEMIREIATGAGCEITQIMFTTHHHLTCLAGQEIQIWESDGLSGETPKFSSIVLF